MPSILPKNKVQGKQLRFIQLNLARRDKYSWESYPRGIQRRSWIVASPGKHLQIWCILVKIPKTFQNHPWKWGTGKCRKKDSVFSEIDFLLCGAFALGGVYSAPFYQEVRDIFVNFEHFCKRVKINSKEVSRGIDMLYSSYWASWSPSFSSGIAPSPTFKKLSEIFWQSSRHTRH